MRFLYFTLSLLLSLSAAIAQQKPTVCGTGDDALPVHILEKMARLPAIMQQQTARAAANEMNICRISVEIDYQTYIKFEKDTNAIYRKVLENLRTVSEVYEREINTRMVATSIRIFKSQETDPFNASNNIFTLLSILKNSAPANPDYDKRAYFYTKVVTGASGLAITNGAISIARLNDPQEMMHEFGHNFASPHTHNCAWPGGPIDFCASPEGDCYDKAIEMLNNKSGTIMSYCYSEPTFHPLCQAIMRDHADNAFSKILTSPDFPRLNASMQVSKGDLLIWPAVLNALSYEVSYASKADFSDSKTVSVPFNGFAMKSFPPGTTVFVKIRAVNTFGNSSWSNPANVKIDGQQLPRPDLTSSETAPIVQSGESIPLTYSEVPGATGYEIQIAYNHDISFDYPFFTTVSTTSTYQYAAESAKSVRWRVRAISGQDKGKWSEIGYFSISPSVEVQLHLYSGTTPTSFPFTYTPLAPFSKVKLSISDNSAFNNTLFTKEYSTSAEVIDVVPELPANTQLYFRVEEWNQNSFSFPLAKVADHIFPFKTGSTNLPGNLTFLSGLSPNVFDKSNPQLVATTKSLWLASQSNGFIRVNINDLSHQVFNQKNTGGQIGFIHLNSSIETDDSLKLHILSREGEFSYRKVKIAGDTPDNNGLVSKFDFTGFFSDYIPSHNLYWESKIIYKESNSTLVPFKTIDQGLNIRKISSAAGKIWILAGNNSGRDELIVVDPVSGAEIERINASTQPELLPALGSFVVSNDGQLMILQYDASIVGYRTALRDKSRKWTVSNTWFAPFVQSSVQNLTCSPAGDFYVTTIDDQTHVFKYNPSGWEKVGADIPLRLFTKTFIADGNNNLWFSCQYGVARLTVSQLSLISTDKTEYFANDSITVTMSIGDKVNVNNFFTVSLKNSDGKTETVRGLSANGSKIRFRIPSGFIGQDIELRVKSSDPETNSDNALHVTIHQPLVTGISEPLRPQVKVYPNPSANRILLELEQPTGKPSVYYITDSKGVFWESMQVREKLTEWDISKLNPGIYVLWTVQNGHKRSWKIVKN